MLQRETVEPATLELLIALMRNPVLSGFHLAGGTSLALQLGHRVSVDLDLFGQRPFKGIEILDALQDLVPIITLGQSENIIQLSVKNVKVDFVNYRYPNLFPILEDEGVRLFSIQDIGAMKLAAIAGRGKKRDFYDIYFLLQQFTLTELLEFYKKKYYDGSVFVVMRSLAYFEDADQDEAVQLLREDISWDNVKHSIESALQEIR